MADLHGRVVAFLEARRAAELASLIERHGGQAFAAPCLREVHAPEAPELQAALGRLCAADVKLAVFLTGVGASTVFEAARLGGREQQLRDALERATVAVRGPKPLAVLRKLQVRVDITAPPPNTTAQVIEAFADVDLESHTVVVQLYGESNPELTTALTARGASDIIELVPYRWEPPEDLAPVQRLFDALDAGNVDALLVTSQAQVDNLFKVAERLGRPVQLGGVAIGVQGPVAEAALARNGYTATFRPEHGHMGALVLQAANHLSPRLQGAV